MRKLSNLSVRELYQSGQRVTSVCQAVAGFIRLTLRGWALLLAVILILLPAADILESIRTAGDVIALLKSTLWLSIIINLSVVMFWALCSRTL